MVVWTTFRSDDPEAGDVDEPYDMSDPDADRQATADVFAVPVGPGGGLEAAAAALARLLAGMPNPDRIGAVFMYPKDQPGRFTQLLVDVENGAWVECVSNNFLADHDQLDPEREQMLVDLGFLVPDDDHPNFWLIQDPPVRWPEIAGLMVAPFATVFPVHEAQVMELTVKRNFSDLEDAPWQDDLGETG